MKPRSESMSSIRKIKKDKKRVTRKNLASFRGLLKPPAMRVCGLLNIERFPLSLSTVRTRPSKGSPIGKTKKPPFNQGGFLVE